MKDSDREALIAGSAPCVFLDARLIDGVSDEPLERGFVRVREGRISEVGPMADFRSAGREERTVELTGQSLLPGLIDCHVHFVYSGFPNLEEIDRCPVEAAAINAVVNGGRMRHRRGQGARAPCDRFGPDHRSDERHDRYATEPLE